MPKTKILKAIPLDERLRKLETFPIILNTLPLETEQDRKYIESLCITSYTSTDMMATTPTCRCGKMSGGANLGVIASCCGTRVVSHHHANMTSDVWIAIPDQIGYTLSPLVWIFFSNILKAGNWNGLRWALDPSYPTPELNRKKATAIVRRFERIGYRRGLGALHSELDKLISVTVDTAPSDRRSDLMAFLTYYEDCILTKHIPVPSRIAFVVEDTPYGKYYDNTMSSAIDAIFSAADANRATDIKRLETRFTEIMANLCKYYLDAAEKNIASKPGWLRRVNFGRRMNFTFRSIATSEHNIHNSLCVKLPYHQLVTVLRPLLISRLIAVYGFTWGQSRAYVSMHATDKDPFLWKCLEELIDDTPEVKPSRADVVVKRDKNGKPYLSNVSSTLKTRERKGGGIWVAITRYPSLARTSTTGFRIVGITDNEIRYSVLSLVGPNLDFDGDMVTGTISLDVYTAENFSLLQPYYDIHNTTTPLTMKKNIRLPDVIVTTIANWHSKGTTKNERTDHEMVARGNSKLNR